VSTQAKVSGVQKGQLRGSKKKKKPKPIKTGVAAARRLYDTHRRMSSAHTCAMTCCVLTERLRNISSSSCPVSLSSAASTGYRRSSDHINYCHVLSSICKAADPGSHTLDLVCSKEGVSEPTGF